MRMRTRGLRWGQWEDRTEKFNVKTGPDWPNAQWAKLNNRYSVQAYIRNGGWLHLMIRRHDNRTSFPWRDLQRIKNELVGEMYEAIEVFPRAEDLVDVANMRHLFVTPPGRESLGARFRPYLWSAKCD